MTTTQSEWNRYSVSLGSLEAELKVAPDESESGVAVVEHTLPARTLGAPLHRHSEEDEISYVLSGELTVRQGESVSTVGVGESVVKPRGVWHTFWNSGDEPVRFLEVISPGEFAGYFEDAAATLEASLDPAALAPVAEEYGLEMRPESVPDLLERHDLRI